MATAKKNMEKKLVETEVQNGVTLTLTNEEARAIMLLWSITAGCPSTSARHKIDNIAYALREQGYNYPDNYYDAFEKGSSLAFSKKSAQMIKDK